MIMYIDIYITYISIYIYICVCVYVSYIFCVLKGKESDNS